MAASGIAGPFLSNSPESCSPVTDFMNPNAGGGNEWLYASVEDVGIASGCSVGGCIFNFKDTPWLPSTVYTVGQEILDSHFQIQAVAVGGTSGATVPTWQHVGLTTTDGTVQWICQGVASAITLPAWLAGHSYSLHNKILDNNNNVQFASVAGKSGGTIPTFNQTPGGTTSDGTNGLVWTNIGSIATADMPASGGTSGIIIDNTVGTGTLAGASQVYFSTLSDQACGTSGTGGCAVQSSQAGLH
jgi:hypothetical protein